MPRRPGFITPRFGSGFTFPLIDSPRFPGLLMPGSSEQHGLRLSFSFGPSLFTSSYYGLC